MPEILNIRELKRYFPVEKQWKIVEVGRDFVDARSTEQDTPIRCIDRDFGFTPHGYDPESVPLSPAWLGAVDGVASFMKGTLKERLEEAARRTKSVGFKAANHGDYAIGDTGCAYRRAWIEGRFKGLPRVTREEYRILTTKTGLHYYGLHRPDTKKRPKGFILNEHEGETVLPNGGDYYPTDIWFAREVGIPDEKSLPVIAKTGELLLTQGNKTLFIVRD